MRNLADHIIDLAGNGIKAGARQITVRVSLSKQGILLCEIEDNGSGMSSDELSLCAHPFYSTGTSKKAGLGLPLIEQNSRAAGGDFWVQSKTGKGTKVSFTMNLHHPDVLPCGDLVTCFTDLMVMHPDSQIMMVLSAPEFESCWDSDEILNVCRPLSVRQKVVRDQLSVFLNEGIAKFYHRWNKHKILITKTNTLQHDQG